MMFKEFQNIKILWNNPTFLNKSNIENIFLLLIIFVFLKFHFLKHINILSFIKYDNYEVFNFISEKMFSKNF